MNLKRIFSIQLANKLVNRGHKVQSYQIDVKNPMKKIFLFEKTDKLLADLTELTKHKREQ